VSDWKADRKIALEAYVRMQKLKIVMNNNTEMKKDVLTKKSGLWIAGH
jgi:hypothetical protein